MYLCFWAGSAVSIRREADLSYYIFVNTYMMNLTLSGSPHCLVFTKLVMLFLLGGTNCPRDE
jgi:hypothetical protein